MATVDPSTVEAERRRSEAHETLTATSVFKLDVSRDLSEV
jgi:hypothetical protein